MKRTYKRYNGRYYWNEQIKKLNKLNRTALVTTYNQNDLEVRQ